RRRPQRPVGVREPRRRSSRKHRTAKTWGGPGTAGPSRETRGGPPPGPRAARRLPARSSGLVAAESHRDGARVAAADDLQLDVLSWLLRGDLGDQLFGGVHRGAIDLRDHVAAE